MPKSELVALIQQVFARYVFGGRLIVLRPPFLALIVPPFDRANKVSPGEGVGKGKRWRKAPVCNRLPAQKLLIHEVLEVTHGTHRHCCRHTHDSRRIGVLGQIGPLFLVRKFQIYERFLK